MAGLGGSAWTAVGFVLGAAAGGALAARLAGKAVLPGRRCAGCGASLSPWPRFPILSWFGVVPHCRRCGLDVVRFHSVVEAGIVLIGLAAIFASPFPAAIYVALAGWSLLLLLAFLWRRLS
ncbi:MAG: Type 4 prepilin-like protein leader peptide-processing enzyme [Alphaproteobacteria bacterium]|nr:Type 4 prepilin-like protein leader peptide-processing enzyme [Alphaproteobacteria bacterium]